MPEAKTEQINFRVSPGFRQRIESECIKRETSLQNLITTAIKGLMTFVPTEQSAPPEAPGFVSANCDQFLKSVPPPEVSEEERSEFQDWLGLWVKYINDMPRAKTLLIVEVLKLDLLHYHSSRRKVRLKKVRLTRRRRMDRQEESNVETQPA